MSKLYLTARTDISRTDKTARGNKRADASIGYNPSDYSKKIRMTVIRDDDKLELTIMDKNQTLLVCDGTIQKGIIECQPHSYGGPMPKLSIKSMLE